MQKIPTSPRKSLLRKDVQKILNRQRKNVTAIFRRKKYGLNVKKAARKSYGDMLETGTIDKKAVKKKKKTVRG